jgi:hypothetical protein
MRLPGQAKDMKNKSWPVTFLSTTAFVVVCEKEQTTSQQMDKFQTETKQAVADMKYYPLPRSMNSSKPCRSSWPC